MYNLDGVYNISNSVYGVSYIIYNVSHTYAVKYNISGSGYSSLSSSTTAYTIICIIGWIFTNVNTYKYEI